MTLRAERNFWPLPNPSGPDATPFHPDPLPLNYEEVLSIIPPSILTQPPCDTPYQVPFGEGYISLNDNIYNQVDANTGLLMSFLIRIFLLKMYF